MEKVLSKFSVLKSLIWGHFFLAAMGVVYCIAWTLDFSNEGFMDLWYSKLLYYISLIGTTISFFLIMEGTRICNMDLRRIKIKLWHIAIVGLIVYIVSFILTTWWYKRIFTAELFLLIIWAILQSAVIIASYYAGYLSKKLMVVSWSILSIGILLSIIFYNYYYSYTGYTQLNLGLYPYGILIIVALLIAIFLKISERSKPRIPKVNNEWDEDFKKENRSGLLIWLTIGIAGTIPNWIYLVMHTYRGDMIASQYILGAALGFLILYYPVYSHYSIPGYRSMERSERIEISSKDDQERIIEGIMKVLGKKGRKVKLHRNQLFISDLKMAGLHVIEVMDGDLLILVQELYRWPNPMNRSIRILWTEENNENRKVIKSLKKAIDRS